jgi:hypothetical protein
MGTVEPRYNDLQIILDEDRSIVDDGIAFIYGAIKKYGYRPNCIEELKEYIKGILK